MLRYFIVNILFLTLLLSRNHEQLSIDESLNFSKTEKYALTNVALGAGILTWGFSQWGYGDEKFHFDNEGWFENDTSNGGSDKLGHFYTNYLITRLLCDVYSDWGYSKDEAALYASFSSLAFSSLLIEVGDGYSEHGFSKEDLTADVLGVGAGYLLSTHPNLANKIDFRVEYLPTSNSENVTDFTTNYEQMKHLMVLKADGFEALDDTYLDYLELHLGYYSRNFNHDTLPLGGRERTLYVGIGVNLSKLLSPYLGTYSKLFNYYQVPHTYVELGKR